MKLPLVVFASQFHMSTLNSEGDLYYDRSKLWALVYEVGAKDEASFASVSINDQDLSIELTELLTVNFIC